MVVGGQWLEVEHATLQLRFRVLAVHVADEVMDNPADQRRRLVTVERWCRQRSLLLRTPVAVVRVIVRFAGACPGAMSAWAVLHVCEKLIAL